MRKVLSSTRFNASKETVQVQRQVGGKSSETRWQPARACARERDEGVRLVVVLGNVEARLVSY